MMQRLRLGFDRSLLCLTAEYYLGFNGACFLLKKNNKRRRVSVIHSKKGLPMDIVGFMVYE